jgi:hypothetical protein
MIDMGPWGLGILGKMACPDMPNETVEFVHWHTSFASACDLPPTAVGEDEHAFS